MMFLWCFGKLFVASSLYVVMLFVAFNLHRSRKIIPMITEIYRRKLLIELGIKKE